MMKDFKIDVHRGMPTIVATTFIASYILMNRNNPCTCPLGDGGGTEERIQLINSHCAEDGGTFLHLATKVVSL